jgi:hypothetical protein
MDNKIVGSTEKEKEKGQALEILERHKSSNGGHYWSLALATLLLAAVSFVLYLYSRDDRLIITPILPIVFGLVGLVKSKSSKGIIFSFLSLFLGAIMFTLLFFL